MKRYYSVCDRVVVSMCLLALMFSARAQPAGDEAAASQIHRYTLILDDPAVSVRFSAREGTQQSGVRDYREQIRQAQQVVRQRLEAKGIGVVGAVDTLLNALFVTAPSVRLAELAAVAGVKGVAPARMVHAALNKAAAVVNAPVAWSALGGKENAGKGVKIAIVDSGIDQNHAAFRNSTLPMPAGFPKCATAGDCASFTNNKVIVARSFVSIDAAGSDPKNPAADSRPDDVSPRDRLGHGTAVASCAAGEAVTDLVAFNGIAPGAWLGNYRVFGAPGLNDYASDQTVIAAVEQAVKDGMDIINLSLGDKALTGPLDSGADCGLAAGVPCDAVAAAVEAAVHQGAIVVVSAGNDNNTGTSYPTYNTVGTPGNAPSAITVGASSNSHLVTATASIAGQAALQNIAAVAGSTGLPLKPLSAALVDVALLGNDGQACVALAPGSLYGAIALVKDSGCDHVTRSENLVAAGAVGMILYAPGSTFIYYAPSVRQIPAVQVGNSDGLALKTHLATHPGAVVTITASEQTNTADQMLHFSSIGPNPGDSAIKPDLVAPGGGTWGYHHIPGIYMATQSYDPWGGMYNPDGFTAAQGTSFAAPIVAGAAAVVKSAHPSYTPAQIKSALVNTAAQTILTDDTSQASGHAPYPADTEWFGAGRLDAGAAVAATVTVGVTDSTADTRYLSSLSFGVLTGKSLPLTKRLTITNAGTAPVNLMLAVTGAHGGLAPTVSAGTVVVNASQSTVVTVTLSGTLPAAGEYSGEVTISGSGVSLQVPYMYLVSDGAVASLIETMPGGMSTYPIGSHQVLHVKVLDRYGAPVAGTPVHWINDSAKSTLASDYSNTDKNGVASMAVVLDQKPGDHPAWAAVGDLNVYYSLTARLQPVIPAYAVANAASFDPNQPIAPGSYITIFGTDLSDLTGPAMAARLPLAMGGTFVSFDVPLAGVSAPGYLTYVSPGQINLQVPWELKGQTSMQMKVSVGYVYGKVVTLAAADYSPAFFEMGSSAVAALDINYQLISAGHPVGRGQAAMLFANGLGPVSNPPASGVPALVSPLSEIPVSQVTVTIGSKAAQVLWAGLAPGFPGLYQVNVMVPTDVGAGNQPITVAVGGKTSKASGIFVQ